MNGYTPTLLLPFFASIPPLQPSRIINTSTKPGLKEDMDDESDSPSWSEFRLPEEDFGELMAARRLNPEGTASPSHHALSNAAKRKRFSGSIRGSKRSLSADKTAGSGSDNGISPIFSYSPLCDTYIYLPSHSLPSGLQLNLLCRLRTPLLTNLPTLYGLP